MEQLRLLHFFITFAEIIHQNFGAIIGNMNQKFIFSIEANLKAYKSRLSSKIKI